MPAPADVHLLSHLSAIILSVTRLATYNTFLSSFNLVLPRDAIVRCSIAVALQSIVHDICRNVKCVHFVVASLLARRSLSKKVKSDLGIDLSLIQCVCPDSALWQNG